jgi:hypothetical protein
MEKKIALLRQAMGGREIIHIEFSLHRRFEDHLISQPPHNFK